MATKYIEREALLDAILNLPFKMDEDGYGWLGRRGVWQMILGFPAADARPAVRGKWITEEEALSMGDYSLSYTCSVCGHCDWDCTESREFNFCPNCGADMREES